MVDYELRFQRIALRELGRGNKQSMVPLRCGPGKRNIVDMEPSAEMLECLSVINSVNKLCYRAQ